MSAPAKKPGGVAVVLNATVARLDQRQQRALLVVRPARLPVRGQVSIATVGTRAASA